MTACRPFAIKTGASTGSGFDLAKRCDIVWIAIVSLVYLQGLIR